MKFKHMGIAVHSIDKAMELWSKCFGAEKLKQDDFEIMGQTSALVRIGDTYFELMQPMEGYEKSTVRKFLDTHGEGLHHLSLKSDNLAEDIKLLESQGIKVLGAGQPVVFTHPKTSGGIVFEISEIDD